MHIGQTLHAAIAMGLGSAMLSLASMASAQQPSRDLDIYALERARQGKCVPGTPMCGQGGVPKIINGREAEAGRFPWVVSVGIAEAINFNGHRCGGTIIAERYVLTAAHCFGAGAPPSLYAVQSGTVSLGRYMDKTKVKRILIHPDFDPDTLVADVALLEMQEPFVWSDAVKPVTLEDDDTFRKSGHEDVNSVAIYTVTGFGQTSDNGLPASRLRYADNLPSLTTDKCRALKDWNEPVLGDALKAGMICAGDTNNTDGSDACHGDSGGGLIYYVAPDQPRVAGIVSRGARADGKFDCTDNPLRVGVYTKVSTYLPAIEACINHDPACIFRSVN
ncbi:serine protease [Mesorhizobium salmacidum]|uniref:Serine protease n=1 Tax=Mesorhizobium salmacidum TaxID=3015171 RepID=A0ABU8L5C0_9HYPH